MGKRSCGSIIQHTFILGLMLFLFGCSPSMSSEEKLAATPEEESMSLAQKIETVTPIIPTIDAAAPSHFETASFGLG
jgi:hypothetical protein